MKKTGALVILLIVSVFLISFFMSASYVMQGVEIYEVEKQTFEKSENFMFREEKWSWPIKGFVVEMQKDIIPLGIAGDTSEINFGRVPENSSTTKIMNFNAKEFARVEFYTAGNMSPYVEVPENFYMENEEMEIKLNFIGRNVGNFTGTLMIRNIIPKNFLARMMV